MALSAGTRVHGNLPRRRTMRPTGPGSFALNVQAWVDKAKERGDLVVQDVTIKLLSSVNDLSPVGNPELWAVNASSVYGRETYNLFADRQNAEIDLYNAGLASQGESAYRGTKLIGAMKPIKRAGRKKLASMFPIRAGKGYVGGRFKGNWQVSINSQPVGVVDGIDPSGAATLAKGSAVAKSAKAGTVIYIQNNVPYALALEYGHSKQAPAGMVRVTVARFQELVDEAARETRAQIP